VCLPDDNDQMIDLQDLPAYLQAPQLGHVPHVDALERQERLLILRAFEEAGGNVREPRKSSE